jgi:hypothetical protein
MVHACETLSYKERLNNTALDHTPHTKPNGDGSGVLSDNWAAGLVVYIKLSDIVKFCRVGQDL